VYPEYNPTGKPINSARNTPIDMISRLVRVPNRTRLKMSRPRSSVPIRC